MHRKPRTTRTTPTWVSYAPQARIIGRHVEWLPTSAAHGWCVSPEQLDAMGAVASETFTSTSAPIQHAAVRAFADDPEIEIYLRDARHCGETLEAIDRICNWVDG